MRLLIVEKSPILRKRLTRLFSELGYVSLVAFVEELDEVQKIASEEKPDVIVIDMDYPNPNNLKMLTLLKKEINRPKLVIITETIEPKYIRQFQDSGADMVFNIKDDLSKFIGHLNLIDGVVNKTALL
jgi:DNA-binding NarL/FixJ family response regulator